MAKENFARSLKLVLVDEGGLDDDPHDHGGRTAYGIIQREYDGYRRRHGKEPRDVWKITIEEYSEIYHHRYWQPVCDRLPLGLDYVFFDDAVNTGPRQAARNLQRALGNVRVDGFVGDATLGACADCVDLTGLIKRYCEQRRQFYRCLKQFPRYGKGWLNRVRHVEKGALAMVAGDSPRRKGMDDDLKSQATARAQAEDKKKPPISAGSATVTTTASTVGSAIAEQLQQMSYQLNALSDTLVFVQWLLVAIALVSGGFAIYAIWQQNRVKEAT